MQPAWTCFVRYLYKNTYKCLLTYALASILESFKLLNLVAELGHAWSRIHKILSTLSKVIGDGGGGIPTPPFIL